MLLPVSLFQTAFYGIDAASCWYVSFMLYSKCGMLKYLRNNSLSIVFLLMFLLELIGQFCTGMQEHNKDRAEDGEAAR